MKLLTTILQITDHMLHVGVTVICTVLLHASVSLILDHESEEWLWGMYIVFWECGDSSVD